MVECSVALRLAAPSLLTALLQHPFEHLNYIISGHGTLVSENGNGFAIKQGDFAMVLPDEVHQYRNDSETEPLVVICAVPREFE